MEMRRLLPSERIFPLEDPRRHDIDEIDEVDPEDRDCGRDLAPCDDRERREDKCEHDCPWVSHDHSTRYICSSEEKCRWYNHREEDEEKSWVLDRCRGSISEWEFQSESSHDDEWYEGKSSRESRDSVREIHTVKNEDIPENRYDERDIVDTDLESLPDEIDLVVGEINNPPENITHIWDLDTRETDDNTDSYLHEESEYRRNPYPTLSDRIEIIDEGYDRDEESHPDNDMETMFEDRCKVDEEVEDREKYDKCHEDRYPRSVGNWRSSFLCFIQMWSVEKLHLPESPRYSHKYKGGDHAWEYKDDENIEREVHGGGDLRYEGRAMRYELWGVHTLWDISIWMLEIMQIKNITFPPFLSDLFRDVPGSLTAYLAYSSWETLS